MTTPTTMAVGDLTAFTLDDLSAMLGQAGDDLRAAILAECDRRDGIGPARPKRRDDPERDAWEAAAHEQYLRADAYCRGHLLSKAGKAAGVADWPGLWQGPASRAEKHASRELREWWELPGNARLTVGEWRRQERASRREQREQYDCLPVLDDLIEMVRAEMRAGGDGTEVLGRYTRASGINDLLSTRQAADWIGVKPQTISSDRSHGRWPKPDMTLGQAGAWKRRTIILALAARHGLGAPGRPRAKRTAR